uniref:Uncharacterized protein n=1 Tax=viral metagenome TaxID=1070528 RepID=A0A6C0K9I7_9ZZZZ
MELVTVKSKGYTEVRDEISKALGIIKRDPTKYPGGQPIHLNKGDILDILKKKADGNYKYAINLKADGVRYIMFGGPLVDSNGRSESAKQTDRTFRRPYFVNRRFDIYRLQDRKVLLQSRSPVILDGEIVEFNAKKKRMFHLKATLAKHIAFNVFDALLTETTGLNDPSTVRWKAAEAFVAAVNAPRRKPAASKEVQVLSSRRIVKGEKVSRNSNSSSSSSSNGSTLPKGFSILMTRHVDISVLGTTPQNMSTGDDAYTFLVNKLKESYRTSGYTIPFDGIVFTPWDMPYICGPWTECANICYKWKPQFQATVDLVVKRDPGGRGTWFATKSQRDVNKVEKGKTTWLVPPERVERLPGPDEVPHDTVVELRYFPQSGNFEFTQARHDKSRDLANAHKTVQNVLRQHFSLEVVNKFIKNPEEHWRSAMEYVSSKETIQEMAKVMVAPKDQFRDHLKKMCKGKATFVRVDYPTDTFHNALRCLSVLYPRAESMAVQVKWSGHVSEYMPLGSSGNTWVRQGRSTATRKGVAYDGTNVSERKHKPSAGISGADLNEAHVEALRTSSQRVFRTSFATHFGSVVFEKHFDGDVREPKLAMYSDIKTMKKPIFIFKLIKEFNYFLSKQFKDKKK